MVKNNQDNDFNDNKLTNEDSKTINSNPTLDSEVSIKNYIDDEVDKNTVVRFNQTLQNYLKVSVGDDTYNLSKHNKIQMIDTTVIKSPSNGGYLLQIRDIECNDKNGNGKIQKSVKSTKTNSSSSHSGATSLPPIGNNFMYIETSSNKHGNGAYVF